MQPVLERTVRNQGWGILASVVFHAVLAALLIFGFPLPLPEPQQEPSVTVELAQPEENAEPKEDEPQKQAEAPEPEKPEKPPEVEKQEEDKPAQPPPAGSKPEEDQARDDAEKAAAAAAKEAAAKQAEAEAKAEAETRAQEARQKEPEPKKPETETEKPLPVLRQVEEFAEKASGPRKSETGNAAQEASPEPAQPREEPAASPALAEPAPVEPDGENPLDRKEAEQARTARPSAQQAPLARELFSPSDAGGMTATTAMGALPRSERAGELCASALRDQLRIHAPQYRPEVIPTYRLREGTVLQVRSGAFRANGQWFDLKFRCQVDADATRITSFAFDVGEPIPRSQWRRRGFPAF